MWTFFEQRIYNILVAGIFVLFVILHLVSIHAPYHQDEYKWPLYANPAVFAPGAVPHPPLTELIYRDGGHLVGYDNFRYIPFIFGILNFFLLFYLVRFLFNTKTATMAVFLFTISFYSLLASLMVDTDGAVLPFFFLLACIGYFKWKRSEWKNWKWLLLFTIGIVFGFLVKVSGALSIIAFALDFAIEKKVFADRKKLVHYGLYALLIPVGLGVVLLVSKIVFPFFNFSFSLKYWEHFANSSSFLDRGWLQTFIQFIKSILYASPLLVLPLLLFKKESYKIVRPLIFFIGIGLFFYLFAFDFSIGALDRYFEFLVVPLCIISATVYTGEIEFKKSQLKDYIAFGVIAVLLFLVQFLPHFVPPLYPKTEWMHRVLSLSWNFLFPFTGGSGPMPFYVSFLYMALVWICAILIVVGALKNSQLKRGLIVGLFIVGVTYNIVFIEEYSVGGINGSAPTLIKQAVAYIDSHKDSIQQVVVYNDNGGYNIQETGTYLRRLYVDPKFDLNEKIGYLNSHKVNYLVIDIPHIDPNTMYAQYFSSCDPIFQSTSGVIHSYLYDCRKAADLTLQ